MIEHYSFGKFIVDKKTFESNITVINDKAKKHRHLPEHQLVLDDFKELVEADPDYIIIGTGASGVVEVPEKIIDFIESKGIKLIIEKTADACGKYNKMIRQGKNIAAFLHNTC